MVALTSIACISITSTLTSCGLSADQIKTLILPTVKQFTDYQYKSYTINEQTSLAYDETSIPNGATPEYPRDGSRRQMVKEIIQNISGEYYAKLLQTKHPLNSHVEFKTHIDNNEHEISFIFINDHLDNLPEITINKYPEAYQIEIGNKIIIKAFNEQGWIIAARTLLQLQVSNGSIPYGKMSDWPKIKERGIEFDFSGRGYSLNFVADLIKSMSWNKLNTLALRFASGGMRLDCKKTDEVDPEKEKPTSGTWFKIDWSQFDSTGMDYFNLNTNYRDNSPTWDYREGNDTPESGFSDFGNILNLAFKEGVNIIPEINIFTHAWFLTDLTAPRDIDGKIISDGRGVTDSNVKAKDFAIWDDRSDDPDYPLGKRIPDSLDLRGKKPGSKAVIDLCKRFVTYMANRFTSVGNYNKHALLSFGIGGDEYIETLDNSWNGSQNANIWTASSKQDIVNSIYTFSKTMYDVLKTSGVTNVAQWSDSLLKQYPNNDWPKANATNWDPIVADADLLTIKHWWSKYGNASIDDFTKLYVEGRVGGGIQNVVNYNSDLLYFSDDESNTSSAPTTQSLFDSFHPGIFAGNAGLFLDNNGVNYDEYPTWLRGSMLSVWWDWSPHVATMIDGPMRAFAQKTWNGTNNALSFNQFNNLVDKLGRAPLIDWN